MGPYWDRMKESWAVYQWVYKELIPQSSKKRIKIMMIPMFLYAAFGVFIPYCLAGVIDGLVAVKDAQYIVDPTFWDMTILLKPAIIWLSVVVLFMVVRLWLHHSYMIHREHVKTANQGEIERIINKKLLEKSRGQHLRYKNSLSQSSINRARSRIQYLESLMLFQGLSAIFDLLISFTLIWVVSPVAGLITSIAFVYYLIQSVMMNKNVADVYRPIDDEYKVHNDKLEEMWDKAIRVKSFGTEEDIQDLLTDSYAKVSLQGKNFWIDFIKKIRKKDLVNVIALAIVYVYATYSIGFSLLAGVATIGVLVPIYSWTWGVVANIWRVGHIEMEFNWCMSTIKKLKESLEIKPDIVDSNPSVLKITKTPHLRFENVSFSYIDEDGKKNPTLRDICFDVKPGEKVALIGESGAGKSTLGHLILRGSDPDSGMITLDGVDLRDVSIKAWMDSVGEIPQDLEIFNDTMRANLLKAIPSDCHGQYSDEDILEMMENFAINFNGSLPKGLDTELGHKGMKLSGGQKQRVAIGQMALKNPNILVVDEATSSLDATTTRKVQKGFEKLFTDQNHSGIFIAHNLSTVKDLCDKFIILRSLDSVPEGESQIEAIGSSLDELYHESRTLEKLMDDQDMTPLGVIVEN